MRFSLEQLEAFVATHQTGSFSAAARKIGKAQSVISTAVSNLELDCGVSLFSREGRYPVLTEEGRALLSEAEFILNRCTRFTGMADQLSQSVESHLVLAIDEMAFQATFEQILLDLGEKFPDLEVTLLHPVLDEVLQMVVSGEADFGITLQLNTSIEALDVCSVGTTELTCVVSPTHPLAQQQRVELANLSAYRQVVIQPRSTASTLSMQMSPQTWFVENAWSAAELIKRGNWWGLVPMHVVSKAIASGELIVVDTRAMPSSWHVPTDLLWLQGKATGPVANWLRNAFINLAQ